MTDPLIVAREAAAAMMAERGYAAEARAIAAGDGDDFAEVRIALQLIRHLEKPSPAIAPARRRHAGEEC